MKNNYYKIDNICIIIHFIIFIDFTKINNRYGVDRIVINNDFD